MRHQESRTGTPETEGALPDEGKAAIPDGRNGVF